MAGDPDPKQLMEYSREAEGDRVFDSEMGRVDRVLLGTLLRIAQRLDQILELQTGTPISTIEVTGGTVKGPPSDGSKPDGSTTKSRTTSGNRQGDGKRNRSRPA